MSEIDDLREELNALRSQVTSLQSHISDVDESMSNHVGLDWGASGQNYPHPNQSVSVAEYGGGIMRLDSSGAQIAPVGTTRAGALRFVNPFFIPETSGYPAVGTFGAELNAYVNNVGDISTNYGVANDLSGALPSSPATRFAYLNNVLTGSRTQVNLNAKDGTGLSNASLTVESQSLQGINQVYILGAPFLPDIVTADYSYIATVGNGAIWYRGDINKMRLRTGGVTENVATESYVAANAGGTVKTEQMITPWSWCSLGVQLAAVSTAAPASAAWETANRAVFVPFTLDESTTFTKAFWWNGATVSGNVDIGIYNEAGVRQVSMGTTAQATINVMQEVNIADTTLAAGRYYMALACDNITATFFSVYGGGGGLPQLWKGAGKAEMAAAFPLPAPATLATPSSAFIPYFGFSIRTLVT